MNRHTPGVVVQCRLSYSDGTRFTLLAPLHVPEGRSLREPIGILMQQGLTRLDREGEMLRMDDYLATTQPDEPGEAAHLSLLIDRLAVARTNDALSRMTDSVETALFEGHG